MRDRIVAWLLGFAVLMQGIGMVLLGRLEGRSAVQTLVVSAALALLVAQGWRVRMRLNHRVDMLLVMAACGGLGMLAGWWVDLGFEAPARDAGFHVAMGHGSGEGAACPHHAAGAAASDAVEGGAGSWLVRTARTTWQMAWTWMTGLMLLAAIPAGVALTRCAQLARTGWRRWVSTHLVGNALMVLAMIWVGHWIGPGIAHLTGSAVVGGHVGMLLGMLVGMEIGMFAGEALLGLKPWREWRWGVTYDDILSAGGGVTPTRPR